jgi:hypothetical protein
MPKTFELSRWRDLEDPISPLDPIQPDSPRYEAGHLPVGFVMLLWDGKKLSGPVRFNDQEEADKHVLANFGPKKDRGTLEYLIVPKPENT